MNNDAINSAPLTQEALQNNLINALTRLQHITLEKDFLDVGAIVDADARPESFFGFGIGNYQFMVMANCFCEVFVDAAIAAVPNAPESLVGLSNIRGVLIPVYQIHTALNLQLPKKVIIFVVGKSEVAVGLLIDSLPVSLSLSAYQREALGKQENKLLQQLVHANYFENKKHWLLLNGIALGKQLLNIANPVGKSAVQLSTTHTRDTADR